MPLPRQDALTETAQLLIRLFFDFFRESGFRNLLAEVIYFFCFFVYFAEFGLNRFELFRRKYSL